MVAVVVPVPVRTTLLSPVALVKLTVLAPVEKISKRSKPLMVGLVNVTPAIETRATSVVAVPPLSVLPVSSKLSVVLPPSIRISSAPA